MRNALESNPNTPKREKQANTDQWTAPLLLLLLWSWICLLVAWELRYHQLYSERGKVKSFFVWLSLFFLIAVNRQISSHGIPCFSCIFFLDPLRNLYVIVIFFYLQYKPIFWIMSLGYPSSDNLSFLFWGSRQIEN